MEYKLWPFSVDNLEKHFIEINININNGLLYLPLNDDFNIYEIHKQKKSKKLPPKHRFKEITCTFLIDTLVDW